MRRAVPFAILAGCLAVGVLPALAADQDVAVRDIAFSPARVAVKPGESVTWRGNGTTFPHNVHFDGEIAPLGGASTDYTATRQFNADGVYGYYCDVHAGTMRGTVYVNATGTVPTPTPSGSSTPTPTSTATQSPSPSSTTSPGSPATGPGSSTTGGGGAVSGVSAFRARAARSRFCTRRTAACRKPGVFLLVDLAAPRPVRLRGTLRRGARRVRTVSMLVSPGHRRVRLPGRRLKPGAYALTLRAGDITRRVRFRVARR